MESKKRRKLKLKGLNVESLIGNSAKSASILGLIEQGGRGLLGAGSTSLQDSAQKTRLYRKEAAYISR